MDIRGKKLICLGDSITEGWGASDSSRAYVSLLRASGEFSSVANYGVAGTRIARQTKNPFDGGFGSEEFETRAERMEEDGDIIFVFGGTNDFGHGDAPMGKLGDEERGTFYGAYTHLMRYLLAKYPMAQIVAATPVRREQEGLFDEKRQRVRAGTLSQYAQAEREVCQKLGIPVLDLYSTGDVFPEKTVDGLHPNDEGHQVISQKIMKYLKELSLMENLKKEKFDIIVVGGQSNAIGSGFGSTEDEYIPDERIRWINDDSNPRFEGSKFFIDYPAPPQITVAEEPINGDVGKMGKFCLIFAREYIRENRLEEGRKILIVNAAVGGTGFARNEWGVDAVLYRRLKDMTDLALSLNEENRIVAFLWHQGECDSAENPDWDVEKRYATHKRNLSVMFHDFCARYHLENLPIYAAGFCNEWYEKNKVPCDAVLKAIEEVITEMGGSFIHTEDLKSNNQCSGNGDDIHFCRASTYELGRRYYAAYKKQRKED